MGERSTTARWSPRVGPAGRVRAGAPSGARRLGKAKTAMAMATMVHVTLPILSVPISATIADGGAWQ
eukprot:9176494-Pyramimonas_sp.AAC.1